MRKKLFLFSVLAIFFILLSGCIKKAEPMSSYLTVEQVKYLEQKYSSVNECTAMVCKYESKIQSIWDWFKGIFTGVEYPNIKNCEFKSFNVEAQKDKNTLDMLTGKYGLTSSNSEFVQSTMVGVGDTVSAGEDMFAKCNGNLGINLIDISEIPKVGNEAPFKTKFLNMQSCILKSGTIPFYKYGKVAMDTSLLGNMLSKMGPVFISPGYEYSKASFDPSIVPPTAAFSQLNSTCSNCIITATIKYGDFDTIESYRSSGLLVWESIDVIAFTVNISSFSSCDPFIVINNETDSIKWFAQNLTERYHKPVIVIAHGREGRNSANTCEWTNNSIARFYEYLIKYIPELTSSGVIAVIAPDASQLPSDAYKSLGFFCTIYYSPGGTARNFASYAIFSKQGDKPSLCGEYNAPIRMFYEPINYSALPSLNAKKDESCSAKMALDLSRFNAGTSSSGICAKNNLTIQNMAAKHFIDSSLYMAVLQKLGYYQSQFSQIQQYEKHCGTKCNAYANDEQKDLCCLAETMAYYQNKTISKKTSIGDGDLAYFIAYGTLKGESSYNQEFNRYSPIQMAEESDSKQISLSFASSSTNSKSAYLQTAQCDLYMALCKDYKLLSYCQLYDQMCKYQTPTIPPTPTPPTPPGKPTPPETPTSPTQPTQPTQPGTPPTGVDQFVYDPNVKQVLNDAVAIRIACGFK
ncbi:MAG: hypothetical protein N3G74_00730 [Candidatus Micrarchaeota archaeon]|nr:hypothetical protein [Candidatus Micrarchaeota archaeon]